MWVSALDRKLWRDLARLKGQIASIALVVAAGIACFICLRGTYESLEWARAAYYDRYRFADVFAHAERVPESVAGRIEAIPGVGVVDTRIFEEVLLPIEGMERPASAHLLSVPGSGQPALDALALVKGRLPGRGAADEAAVLASFAEAHGLHPGALLPAVVNGKLRQLRITGVVLSPEFVYVIRAGALMNDPQRYTVLWMERSVLASAFGLEGAFDDVTVKLQPGASEAEVRARLDAVLAPYGGDGARGKDQQISNKILMSELSQLQSLAGMVPVVFLAVAAFLLNMVLGRLITLQRAEIATLKAVGYTNHEVERHYLGFALAVLVPGSAAGVVLGAYLGRVVLSLYASLFRFPDLAFRLSPGLVASAIVVSLVAALAGALVAARRAAKLQPAEAMRPPAPATYKRGLVERLGLGALAGPSGLMVVRELSRRPWRSLLSAAGMGGAIALIILGHFGIDSLDSYLSGTLELEQRQDLAVTFDHEVDPRVVEELARTPGVLAAEGMRGVPVRARHENRWRDSVLMGLPEASTLRRLMTRDGRATDLPPGGVLLTKTLADILGVAVGDRVELEVREGDRRAVDAPVGGVLDETVGMQIYARAGEIAALERDEGAVSRVLLAVDPPARSAVEERLRRSPRVVDVSDLKADIGRLRDMNGSMMDIWTAVSVTLSACVIFGVVYNNARISLAARERELATLRVLGMTRQEVSSILVGSLAIEVALAVPAGLVFGRLWSNWFMSHVDQETFRWMVFVSPRTYLLAVLVTVIAAAASALWVRRSLDRLDLIGVLKTRGD